ncbi:ABC transporter permease subunit [Panacibacter ginsenosidivorans]|uniref:ABC transporter permease subunit n=1 Tax=Panacibacter ginsenosidivorans TaxID=1813871 RepID=A0A5B8VDU1_9BACT|nr:ABC transporter permease [Panacibacter ginsenosidivorans]QEC69449.1 ABC transporter permease subunit [Panacibacter ginsenosidivorans]
MFKLIATIKKDLLILTRDKIGLLVMFAMPILLAIVITSVQNSTFELVNDNKLAMVLCNKDSGESGRQLVAAIRKIGMFDIDSVGSNQTDDAIKNSMHEKDAMVAIIIPEDFSAKLSAKAENITAKALNDLGVNDDSSAKAAENVTPITFYYHPVMQQSFRQSIQGALRSALQIVENKKILQTVYLSLNDKAMPDSLENEMINNQVQVNEIPVSRDGSRNIPNASQHNIPAWTIFAMFFIVISLGSSVVREKQNGSFVRLKTLPTNYILSLFSKQVTYTFVTIFQALIIFSIGVWVFPLIGLPALNIPNDIVGLLLVTFICGWCASSYAICVGVFAGTQEQANGFGAVSVVMLAALGGIMIPSFIMPDSLKILMNISPLHWCIEAYYGLFLEGGKLSDIITNILSLFAITVVIQLITVWGLKRKNLI